MTISIMSTSLTPLVSCDGSTVLDSVIYMMTDAQALRRSGVNKLTTVCPRRYAQIRALVVSLNHNLLFHSTFAISYFCFLYVHEPSDNRPFLRQLYRNIRRCSKRV